MTSTKQEKIKDHYSESYILDTIEERHLPSAVENPSLHSIQF